MTKLTAYISGIDALSKEAYEALATIADIEYKTLLSEEALIRALNECDIFWFRLNHQLTENVLKQCRCKYIVCAATGLDHIDIDFCSKKGIEVISLQNESEFLKEVRATAEHAFGLLLALIRNSIAAALHTKSGNWDRTLFQGSELYKKRIGILGMGRLGKIMGQYAEAFGMEVYYFDNRNIDTNHKKCNTIEELFASVDILSIHIPYNKENHHYIHKGVLEAIVRPLYIVNTSRGGVINEGDLLDSLCSNKVLGYATDVLHGEPFIDDNPLLEYSKHNDKVIITPHIGGNTFESIEKTENFIIKKLIKIVNNE